MSKIEARIHFYKKYYGMHIYKNIVISEYQKEAELILKRDQCIG